MKKEHILVIKMNKKEKSDKEQIRNLSINKKNISVDAIHQLGIYWFLQSEL